MLVRVYFVLVNKCSYRFCIKLPVDCSWEVGTILLTIVGKVGWNENLLWIMDCGCRKCIQYSFVEGSS